MLLMPAALVALCAAAEAGVLDRARETGELRLGYRADAQPFSFTNAEGRAAGYSVELCRVVGRETASQLGLPDLRLVEVLVTAADRLEAVPADRVDLLCEATTVTLARRATMDFSLLTFASGATLLYPADGLTEFEQLAGRKVGVLTGSTTEEGLRKALSEAKIEAELVPVASHTDGIERLASGEFAAYFGDGAILLYHLLQSPFRDRLKLSDKVLSFEPYALALPKGDDAFRLVVDRALARLARTREIGAVFQRTFGAEAKPSGLVQALWLLNSVPD
jgi:polar amino acid transport system substrate-binding protein/glutamate/aspartate transport system substrate-binding protein